MKETILFGIMFFVIDLFEYTKMTSTYLMFVLATIQLIYLLGIYFITKQGKNNGK